MTFRDFVIILEALGSLKDTYQEKADHEMECIHQWEKVIQDNDSTNMSIQPILDIEQMDRIHDDAVIQRECHIKDYGAAKRKLADIIRIISQIEIMKINNIE